MNCHWITSRPRVEPETQGEEREGNWEGERESREGEGRGERGGTERKSSGMKKMLMTGN